jgi:hypothetical protein
VAYVLLPISNEAFEEIASEIEARGQPERVGRSKGQIYLTDVVLLRAPEEKKAKREDAK